MLKSDSCLRIEHGPTIDTVYASRKPVALHETSKFIKTPDFTMTEVTEFQIEVYRTEFSSDPKNLLAQNVSVKFDPQEILLNRDVLNKAQHCFQYKVFMVHLPEMGNNLIQAGKGAYLDTAFSLAVNPHQVAEAKPMTNQKSSGRCWIFACLNVIRLPLMKELNIDDFEFSQNHLFFWDKVERANYSLHTFVEVFKKGLPVEGRLVSHLLQEPLSDGGQWDMLVNLIEKYGLIPKKCFPDSHSSGASRRMNALLRSKIREYAHTLHGMVEQKASEEEINGEIKRMVGEIYRVCCILLGTPPKQFTWEYYDKTRNHKQVGPITPQDFYTLHVKPLFNIRDKVCLVNDPRPSNEFGKGYTVEYLGNVVGGQRTFYNNQPIATLKSAAAAALVNGESVWFGCDVGKHNSGKTGIMDMSVRNYNLVFGLSTTNIDKAQRLIFGESQMTHAMVFTGVSLENKDVEPQNGNKTIKWRVENSWGEDSGDKGYLIMSDDWFSEFVYEVVVDKKYLSQEVLGVQTQEPVVLPAWDPMGALAHV